MIHPDARNSVAVRYKIAVTVSDNGGICPVNTHPFIIEGDHVSDPVRFHKKQRQAVLP